MRLAIVLLLAASCLGQGIRSVTIADGNNWNVLWLSSDNSVLFGQQFNKLGRSTDHGSTWTNLHTFTTNGSANVYGIRQLDNGELLVSQSYGGGESGKLFLSSGYPALGASATWTKVLDTGGGISTSVYISGQWGMSSYGNIVVASEYGLKLTNNNSRYAYLSLDYGQTWAVIFDVGNSPGGQTHMHGTAYDPWWKAIWLTNGDSPNHTTRVSFDMGTTWQIVDTAHQFTGILPTPSSIIFLSDTDPSGIYTIPRTNPNSIPAPSVVYNIGSGLIYQGQMPFRSSASPYLCLLPFTSATSEPGMLIGTFDGVNFITLWTDTISYGAGQGLLNIVGPMDNGLIYGALYDGRQANYSKLTMQYVNSAMAGMKFGGVSFQ